MGLSSNPETILLETKAQLLKNALDSLFILRNMNVPFNDEELGILFDKAVNMVSDLQFYLEDTQDYPRWIDVWGQCRGWKHDTSK